MRKIKSALHLYLHYISINLKGIMGYKTSFILTVIGQFLVSFNVFLGIYFMFRRFHRIGDFSYSEVVLCYSIILMEFTLGETVTRGFDQFSDMVKSGSFDRVLVRPRNEILQVLGSKFELTKIGRVIQAILMFAYGISAGGIRWTFAKAVTVCFMLIGGTAVFAGLFLLYAALCFFTLEGLEVINVFTDGAREFGKYPIGVYGEKMLLFTTFVVPYALVQYYPLLYLTERSTNPAFVGLPLLAVLFLIPCHLLWRFGVRRYKSSGS